MNEDDWLTGTDCSAHVRHVAAHLPPRRQRLLAVALCRTVSGLFDHHDLTAALDVIDRYADGRVAPAALEHARQVCRVLAQRSYQAYRAATDTGTDAGTAHVCSELAWAVSFAATTPLPLEMVGTRALGAAVEARTGPAGMLPPSSPVFHAAVAAHLVLMRQMVWEVAGNPFRPVHFAPEWGTDTVRALARNMYESRDFSAMPILADALQDAGCDSDDILHHCRSERDAGGTHVRGCWVLDSVLGLS